VGIGFRSHTFWPHVAKCAGRRQGISLQGDVLVLNAVLQIVPEEFMKISGFEGMNHLEITA
jgi:hypothetical protein